MTDTALSGSPDQSNPSEYHPRKFCTKRFIFTASKIEELKIIAADSLKKDGYEFGYLARVNVVLAFLWHCLVTSSISKTSFSRPTQMLTAVNLRNRTKPQLDSNVCGNFSFLYPTDIVRKESDVLLSEFLKKLLNLRASIDESAKRFDSEEVFRRVQEVIQVLENKDDLKLYITSVWCRFEFYEIDFGMGKPVWMTTISPGYQTSCIYLLDTKEGGIEALLYLEEEEMKAFACNKELLHFGGAQENRLSTLTLLLATFQF